MYADDLAIQAKSPGELQLMLDIVTEYAKRWRFCINPKKKAEMKITRETWLGNLGLLVLLKRLPPMNTGTWNLVRGIRKLALPKFGIKIMATRPNSMISSGIINSASFVLIGRFMVLPPVQLND